MSNQLRVRKPKAILFDIIGTVTKTGFVDRVLFPYVRSNLDVYLVNNWDNRVLKHDVEMLRAESAMDGGPAIVRPSEAPDTIRRSVVDYVARCMDEGRNSDAIRAFRFHMIFDGYNRGHLKTSVYTDVAIGLGNWSTKDNIKLYVYSNGWKYAMKKFLQKTNHDDLSLVVEDYFDTEIGQLNDADSYKAIVSKLGYPAEDILFLTHSGVEGVAAHYAGLSVVLVTTHRDELHRERTEETQKANLPFIRTFDELIFAGDAPAASTMGSSVDYVSPSHTSTAGGGTSDTFSGSRTASGTAMSGSSSTSGSRTSLGTSMSGASSKGGSSSSAGSSSKSSGNGGSTSKGSSGSASSGSSKGSSSATSGSSGSTGSSTSSSKSKSSR